MVTVAIFSIIASLALPSFASMTERWRVHQTTKALLDSISLARSEATRLGGATMRSLSEQEVPACTTARNPKRWECGWTITTMDGTAIYTIETQRGVVVLFRVGGSASELVYHNSGRVSGTLGYGFVVIPAKDHAANPNDCSRAQRIFVSAAGRLRTEQLSGACPS
jgi:type IV fimbrial biogenesis protein FimT